MWSLLRLWHVESLESVIEHPEGVIFTRTSYVTAPKRWRELPTEVLTARLEQLLNAAYRVRAGTLAGSGDDTQMLWFGFYFEWVDEGSAPADPDHRSSLWTLPRANAHPNLVAKAHEEVDLPRCTRSDLASPRVATQERSRWSASTTTIRGTSSISESVRACSPRVMKSVSPG